MKPDNLEQVYEETAKCNRCGYCEPTCPTYAITHLERDVARGRNNLVRALIEGRLEMSREVKSSIFRCLMCDACVTNCHPEVKTDEIVAAARCAYYKEFGRPLIQRFIFEDLLPAPARLGRLIKLGSLGKRTGLSGLVRVLRILGWFGKSIATAEALLPRIPWKFLREEQEESPESREYSGEKVAYFVGCAINFALPHVGHATLQVLREQGRQVELLENCCCGLPPYAYGDLDSARNLARRNLEILDRTDAPTIVTDCASCTSFLKEYAKLLENDPDYREMAKRVSGKVRDITQYLNAQENTRGAAQEHIRVTYHDPCHLSHHLHERGAPREILRNLPGVEFVELPEADWCCGGAGSYNITHVDTSEKILDRKMDNVVKTGAQVLTTACPSCLLQLSYGVRRRKLDIEVKHVVELVAERIQACQPEPTDAS